MVFKILILFGSFRVAHDIFWKLEKNGYICKDTLDQLQCVACNRFLADRFVNGTCPFCAYDDARGDQCDACGKLINAVELKDPKCSTCKASPRIKTTKHLFIDLPKVNEITVKFFVVVKMINDHVDIIYQPLSSLINNLFTNLFV